MMNARSKILALVVLVFGFVNQAQAGLLLEPYLGYVSGKIKQSGSNDFTGSALGARVGFSILGFAIGLDQEMLNVTDDATPKDTITGSNSGLFVSYTFPVLIRVYATYVPNSELTSKASGIPTVKLKDATSTKIGIGYTGLPFLNINLEAHSGEYGKASVSGVEGTFSPKLKVTGYALSLSMPFNLL